MEKGEAAPSAHTLFNLAEALGVSVDYLIGRGEKAFEPSSWLANLAPDLEALDSHGREAVNALVKGLAKGP
jgi:transcriptional regulator with XRE-family HTH domain